METAGIDNFLKNFRCEEEEERAIAAGNRKWKEDIFKVVET